MCVPSGVETTSIEGGLLLCTIKTETGKEEQFLLFAILSWTSHPHRPSLYLNPRPLHETYSATIQIWSIPFKNTAFVYSELLNFISCIRKLIDWWMLQGDNPGLCDPKRNSLLFWRDFFSFYHFHPIDKAGFMICSLWIYPPRLCI